ncbi:hypothetical protein TTHERM_00283070 (macronuclear) [Tetrahymena thermophila SB210]|uniref:Uncharacterized protein n=1 Tax=Tetrahymena thermophila (strain SB210) TaxID=312017 RepID=I7M1W6_TETTS|nr:hypothetical protein TTHERM_00283070 [Tetrahymena thermophila SB210]EAR97918.2 hypothetical protein TTHERM_00283070 [Tetrahymena thermophila SB210]|eukprot:XP_001018163.2 hypothetical protein TTHERM_00283070 [Tetrahymena thermophila SB210]
MSSNSNSPQSKPSLVEIQSKVFLESMMSLRDSKMDDNTFCDDDLVFGDEDDHQISTLNILSNSGSASGRMSRLECIQAEVEQEKYQCMNQMEQQNQYNNLSSQEQKKCLQQQKQKSYERLAQSSKLDKVMDQIKFEEKIQAIIEKQYYKQLSQQCSENIYELFEIPERNESQYYGVSPRMYSSLQFAFN